MAQISLTFPDGNARDFPAGVTPAEVAAGISNSLAKKAISAMDAGQTLRIIATDPGSVKDFEAFCKQTGNELKSSGEENGKFVFMIQKAA